MTYCEPVQPWTQKSECTPVPFCATWCSASIKYRANSWAIGCSNSCILKRFFEVLSKGVEHEAWAMNEAMLVTLSLQLMFLTFSLVASRFEFMNGSGTNGQVWGQIEWVYGYPKFHIPGKWFACLLKESEANYICERNKTVHSLQELLHVSISLLWYSSEEVLGLGKRFWF